MSRASVLVVIVICAGGLAAGVGIRGVLSPPGQIAIYPSQVQFKDGHVEGEPLEAHFELKNESSRAVTITAMQGSCGCMDLSGTDGAFKPPFVLEKWGTRPLTLTIVTAGRVGRQTLNLSITADAGRGTSLQVQAEVGATLLSALRAEPNMVIFRRAKPGSQLSADVKLADALPDPGVRIREIRTSNDETLRVKMEEESGTSPMFGDGVDGHARGLLKLVYTPNVNEGRIQETVTIVPEDGRYPTLQIPVYCEIAEAPYKFTPSGITIAQTSKNAFTRTVVFQSADPREVSVARKPDGIEVEIGAVHAAGRPISIRGDLAVLKEGSHVIVFKVMAHEHVFPIRVMSAN
jgi:hypothetical protein